MGRSLDGNAVRSKIADFRTALYPRQYHPSTLEKPLNKRFFAYKVFFRHTCRRKNEKCGVIAANTNLRIYLKIRALAFTKARLAEFSLKPLQPALL